MSSPKKHIDFHRYWKDSSKLCHQTWVSMKLGRAFPHNISSQKFRHINFHRYWPNESKLHISPKHWVSMKLGPGFSHIFFANHWDIPFFRFKVGLFDTGGQSMVVHNTLTLNCSDQLVDVFLLGKRRFDEKSMLADWSRSHQARTPKIKRQEA